MNLLTMILQYINLGLEHIITGFDHLIFLIALILPSNRLKEIITIITAFTLAHTLTLLAATMGWVTIYPGWIEAGIALTICYVAIENIFFKPSRWRWFITFGFGLIHGFGFASSIIQIGFDQNYFLTSLISFNVGIEAGQIAIVAFLWPFLTKLRSYPWYSWYCLRLGSTIICLIGFLWFVERVLQV